MELAIAGAIAATLIPAATTAARTRYIALMEYLDSVEI